MALHHRTTLVELYETDTPNTADPAAFARLTNLSARGMVGTSTNLLTAGFTIVGNVPRNLLIRAVGPRSQASASPAC